MDRFWQRHIRFQAIVATLMLVVACAEVFARMQGAPPPTPQDASALAQELRAILDSSIPTSVYYERWMRNSTPDGDYTRIELFDLSSRSFCSIHDTISLVVDGVERGVDAGHERLADAKPYTEGAYGALERATGRMYPIAWVHTLLENWDSIQSVVRLDDGGYLVRFYKPHPLPGFQPTLVELHLSPRGIVLQYRLPDYPKLEPIKFVYDPEYPEELMVPADDWVLDRLKWNTMKKVVLPEAPPGAFDFDRLERLAVEYKTNFRDRTVAEVNANRAKAGLDPLPMDPLIQEALDAAKGTKSRWQLPLIVGGGIAIAIGLFAMWRRHGA